MAIIPHLVYIQRFIFILVQNFLLGVADAVSRQLSPKVRVVVEFDNLHACLDITYLMRVYYICFNVEATRLNIMNSLIAKSKAKYPVFKIILILCITIYLMC